MFMFVWLSHNNRRRLSGEKSLTAPSGFAGVPPPRPSLLSLKTAIARRRIYTNVVYHNS
jgi:hypothetical protein